MQRLLTQQFVVAEDLVVVGRFQTGLTNRDRHFADTAEFSSACRQAVALGCPLLLADIEDMLKRTDPRLIKECVVTVFRSGASILDARASPSYSRWA